MLKWLHAEHRLFLMPTVFLLFFLVSATSLATGVTIVQVQNSLKRRLQAPNQGMSAMAMIPLAYRARQFTPFWLDSRLGIDSALAMVEAVGRAEEDGLSPMDYHWLAIQRMMAHIGPRSLDSLCPSPEEYAELDLLLTDAFLLLSAHLTFGKVNPETLAANWQVDPGQAPFLPLLTRAASSGDVAGVLDTLRTPRQEYRALRACLTNLKKNAKMNNGRSILKSEALLREGDHDEVIDVLRSRLIASGDLNVPFRGVDPRFFDGDLAAAVRHFQRRHGLRADGIVGPETIGMINVPVGERIRQVELNLERWRWMPHRMEDRAILVNIAGFYLRAMDAGREELRMRVIVGRPDWPSPVLRSRISRLVLNPFWTVPENIVIKDILPAVRKNPAYLTQREIRVYSTWPSKAAEIDPSSIDWNVCSTDPFPYTLRQDPGPYNALGRIKLMFPNAFDVYLHDTPKHSPFDHARRDESHGCIRVDKPYALAVFLLADDRRWPPERLKACLDSGRTQSIRLLQSVPVCLSYFTAWVDEGGELNHRADIYGRDAALVKALGQPRPN